MTCTLYPFFILTVMQGKVEKNLVVNLMLKYLQEILKMIFLLINIVDHVTCLPKTEKLNLVIPQGLEWEIKYLLLVIHTLA